MKAPTRNGYIELALTALLTLVAVFVLVTDFSLHCDKSFLQVYVPVFLIVSGVPYLTRWIIYILRKANREQKAFEEQQGQE